MASFAHSTLTALQMEVLRAFFERERGFFLTRGAALAGFHLGHRTTDDLDLFTPHAQAFERGRFVLADVAAAIGGELQTRQDAPGFKRLVMLREGEGLDRHRQGHESAAALRQARVSIPDGVVLPAGVLATELRAYVTELIARLLTLSAPP